jgi:hypothetical protein
LLSPYRTPLSAQQQNEGDSRPQPQPLLRARRRWVRVVARWEHKLRL